MQLTFEQPSIAFLWFLGITYTQINLHFQPQCTDNLIFTLLFFDICIGIALLQISTDNQAITIEKRLNS